MDVFFSFYFYEYLSCTCMQFILTVGNTFFFKLFYLHVLVVLALTKPWIGNLIGQGQERI